jgi:hypothetical protein
MIIEMVAYTALHYAKKDNWRCVLCEELGKYTEEEILNHISEKHGIASERLRKEQGGELYAYPVQVKKEGGSDGKSIVTQQFV